MIAFLSVVNVSYKSAQTNIGLKLNSGRRSFRWDPTPQTQNHGFHIFLTALLVAMVILRSDVYDDPFAILSNLPISALKKVDACSNTNNDDDATRHDAIECVHLWYTQPTSTRLEGDYDAATPCQGTPPSSMTAHNERRRFGESECEGDS